MQVTLTLITLLPGISVCPARMNFRPGEIYLRALNRLVTSTSQTHRGLNMPVKADNWFPGTGNAISITRICNTNVEWIKTRSAASFSHTGTIGAVCDLLTNYRDDKVAMICVHPGEKRAPQPGVLTNRLHRAALNKSKKEKK